MPKLREKIESWFEELGHVLYRHRIKTLLAVFLVTAFLIVQLFKLTVDTSSEGMLHEDDPVRINYNAFRDQFGRDEIVVISIKPPDVFSATFLNKLKSFHEDLENETPYVREVRSLMNARHTRAEGDVLYVDDLLQDWPERQVDLVELREQVLKNPVYLNNIISEDGTYAGVIVETEAVIAVESDSDDIMADFEDDTDMSGESSIKTRYFGAKENKEVTFAIEKVAARYNGDDFQIAVSGGPVIVDYFNRYVQQDAINCTVICFIVIIILLGVLFNWRITGIIFPLIIIDASLTSTLGLMGLLHVPLTLVTNGILAFLLAVGVGDAVHILSVFYRAIQDGKSREDAIAYAMGHSGMAVMLTSLTTAAGLLSFSFAELSTIADLGRFAAVGVILALLYTLFLLPPLFAIFPVKKKAGLEKKSKTMDRFLLFFANNSTGFPKRILAVTFLIFVVSIVCMSMLDFKYNAISYFKDGEQVKKNVRIIEDNFKGMIVLEAIVDTQKENGIHAPDVLNSIETLSRKIEKIQRPEIFVGKVFSITDIVKETNQALNGNDPDFYTIPQDRQTIAQELLLFENSGSDDLEKVVDSQFSKTRITIKTPWTDGVILENFMDEMKKVFETEFSKKAEVVLTGGVALVARTIPTTIRSMSKSYVAASIVITIMMICLVGSLKIGLLSMIPNLLPIFISMGIMGIAKVPLDLTTMLIGSIAIGLVVDDTVHFMYNFRKYYDITGDSHKAVRKTLLGTGRALLITSLILTLGFFSDFFATLTNIIRFGLFTGITIIFALLADFIVAPALMVMVMGSSAQNKKD